MIEEGKILHVNRFIYLYYDILYLDLQPPQLKIEILVLVVILSRGLPVPVYLICQKMVSKYKLRMK